MPTFESVIQYMQIAERVSALFSLVLNTFKIVKGDPLRKVWENLLGSPANDISLKFQLNNH